jgi:hypothetical protein
MFIGPDSAKSNVSQEAGRVYRATDTEVEYYSDGTNWVKLSVGSTQESVPEVHTTEIEASQPRGTVAPMGNISFGTEFVREPFSDDELDPQLIHREKFNDGDYRVIVGGETSGDTQLYRTTTFDSFTLIQQDILPNVSGTGQCAGATVLTDGTAVFLQSDDTETRLLTGADFQSLSDKGQFVPEPDGGLYYDEISGELHYYPEDLDNATSVSSDALSHWIADDDDLLNATQQSNALDVSAFDWVTGDPGIIEVGSKYVMLTDQTTNHPNYHVAVATGDDLFNFSVTNEKLTAGGDATKGGDMTAVWRNGIIEAMVEYSGNDGRGVGHWRLYPQHPVSNIEMRSGGAGMTDESGRIVTEFDSSIIDFENIIRFPNGGNGLIEALQNGSVNIGIKDTGGTKFTIDKNEAFFARQGTTAWKMRNDLSIEYGEQDLSNVGSPGDGHIYRHDGSSSINADGGTTSSPGYYVFSATDSEFKSIVQY